MTLRVVKCEAHDLGWVKASDCTHWEHKCPRAKKAKKSDHKFKGGEPGFLIAITGIPSEEWPYDYDPRPEDLELTIKRYLGSWQPSIQDYEDNYAWPQGSRFIPAHPGLLITCIQCGLVGVR